MRRRFTSRILLSFLLLWQLGAGMFVHAHGVAMSHTEPTVQLVHADAALHEHCAEHATAMHADSDTMPMDMAMHEHAGSQHASQPDCCQSLLCKCPCLQALALSISWPYVTAGLPASPAALTPESTLLHAGVSGLFRPPI